MTLDASGNLALGATSAGARFQVTDSSSAAATALMRFVGQNNYQMDVQSVTSSNSTVGSRYNFFVNSSHGEFSWSNSGGERARIDSSGNLLVGTTSAVAKVTVYNPTGNCASFQNDSGATRFPVLFYNGTTNVGNIATSTSTTSYNTSSDYRLKNIDGPLTGSGAFIDALKPKVGTWKADGSRFVGFIAHEVQEVSPGSVTGEKDGEEMQAMEYGSAEFIANIVAELQSLRARVAALES